MKIDENKFKPLSWVLETAKVKDRNVQFNYLDVLCDDRAGSRLDKKQRNDFNARIRDKLMFVVL